MGLFNRLGRKVEELKQEATEASEESTTHRCESCEALLYTDHDVCPECDAPTVVAIEAGDR